MMKIILLEDNENYIVINKPRGIPVQSGTKKFKNIIDTLKKQNILKIKNLLLFID